MNTVIWVKLSVRGTHWWPDAPLARAYLGIEHPHQFGVKVTVPVEHADRAIEFHDLQDAAASGLLYLWNCEAGIYKFGPMSCESIASALGDHLLRTVRCDWVEVEVDEDGQCGATVTKGRKE